MKRRIFTLVLAFLLSIIPVYVNAENVELDKENVSTDEMLEQTDYKEGELIVIFKDGVSNKTIKSIVKNEDASCNDIIKVSEDNKASLVKISDEDDMATAIEKFKDNKKVEYVQPNYKYTFFEDEEDIYKDPRDQYHIASIKAKEAWALIESNTYNATLVAVLDTGVDVYHEDLEENLVDVTKYYATIGGKEIERDYDMDEHGTHVTGIIGATYNNGLGGTGVASGNNNDLVEVMVVGTSVDGKNLYTADVIDAINYAKNHGAKVINMSFGGPGRDRAMEAAVRDAYNSGIVMVAAAGNDGVNDFSSPTDFKEVISVNASNKYDNPTYWSDYGTYKDITAPGNNILSTLPGDDYGYMSGTSMASPVISGVVALMLDANPSLTPSQVYNILCASTGSNSFDQYLGYGIVNAKAAVEAAYVASDSISVTDLYIKDTTASVYVGDNIYLETLVRPATSLKAVSWSSDNESVATVDSITGMVTGVSEGTAVIKASVDGKEVTCTVTVKHSVSQTGITITNKEELENMKVGYMTTVKTKIMPEDATNNEVYYKSSNRKVVDVDEYGSLTAVSSGSATITVKTYDGLYSDSVDVLVYKDARKVQITTRASYWKLLEGDVFTYEAIAVDEDDNPVNNSIVWSSTNPNVANVDPTTGEVTAINPGVTYIVATANDTYRGYAITASSKLTVGKTKYTASEYGLKIANKTYNSVKISWNKIPVALSYVVERSTSLKGNYEQVALVTTNYYLDKDLKFNTAYYYRVKAKYKPDIFFDYSYKKGATTSLPATSLWVNSVKKKTINLGWKKVTGATGYTVYRSTSLKGKYTAIKSLTGTTYSSKNLTSGKRYYYTVKAYRIVNGKKIYGSMSNVINRVAK